MVGSFFHSPRHVEQVLSRLPKPGRQAFKNMLATLRDIMKDKAILFFILAYFFYIDGGHHHQHGYHHGSTWASAPLVIIPFGHHTVGGCSHSILFGNLSKRWEPSADRHSGGDLRLHYHCGFLLWDSWWISRMLGLALERKSLGTILFWILATLVGTVQGVQACPDP